LAGLTNKYHIYASTLDQADVSVMHERIEHGANLLKNNVFQFDFLNDDFTKLPQELQEIINNPEKRKKLVIYINPPYAEATSGIGKGGNKKDVSKETKMYVKYGDNLKQAKNELYAHFLIRIYKEIKGSIITQFSTLKVLQSANFDSFRKVFESKLEKIFIVPADTFDNVTGQFPIGFMIWDTQKKEVFKNIIADVYNSKGGFYKNKEILAYNGKGYINNWIKEYTITNNNVIGSLAYLGNDFQHKNEVRISSIKPTSHISILEINKSNLIPIAIYLSVRQCIQANWLNDRDQFLYPNEGWQNDTEFQNDCLAFALFHSQNKITSKQGTNHWIPFTEYEVNAQAKFESHFMTDFIKGKIKIEEKINVFGSEGNNKNGKREFSAEANAVFDAGRELWKYYHKQEKANANASLYDIREYFQGRNKEGRMNSKSNNTEYMKLINELRTQLNFLADKIKPKIYEYEFLKE
jgi:hypothetical protein